jgi:hypothetical protein
VAGGIAHLLKLGIERAPRDGPTAPNKLIFSAADVGMHVGKTIKFHVRILASPSSGVIGEKELMDEGACARLIEEVDLKPLAGGEVDTLDVVKMILSGDTFT